MSGRNPSGTFTRVGGSRTQEVPVAIKSTERSAFCGCCCTVPRSVSSCLFALCHGHISHKPRSCPHGHSSWPCSGAPGPNFPFAVSAVCGGAGQLLLPGNSCLVWCLCGHRHHKQHEYLPWRSSGNPNDRHLQEILACSACNSLQEDALTTMRT